MTPLLVVINQSTLVTDHEARLMATAVGRQIRKHAAPAWGRVPAPVIVVDKADHLPADAVPIVLLDDADQAGALGYHDETPDGRQYGRVFARPSLEAGGSTALTGPYAVSVVLSHEALEWFIDPTCLAWDGPDSEGRLFAREVGDPVEAQPYQIHVDGTRVDVSNFVFPEWFDVNSPGGVPYDMLGSVLHPLEMTPGGYVITMRDGQVSQTFGMSVPTWQRAAKEFPAARSARRVAVASRPAPRPTQQL